MMGLLLIELLLELKEVEGELQQELAEEGETEI